MKLNLFAFAPYYTKYSFIFVFVFCSVIPLAHWPIGPLAQWPNGPVVIVFVFIKGPHLRKLGISSFI